MKWLLENSPPPINPKWLVPTMSVPLILNPKGLFHPIFGQGARVTQNQFPAQSIPSHVGPCPQVPCPPHVP